MMSVVVVSHLIMHIRGTACHLLQQCRYVLWCYDATPLMLAIMEEDDASMSLGTTRPLTALVFCQEKEVHGQGCQIALLHRRDGIPL